MTDRVSGLFIALDQPYRTDDVETIKAAIAMIKGVSAVINGPVNDYNALIAQAQHVRKVRAEVLAVFDSKE